MKYDKYIVAFSGGKDSISCFLHLLDLKIPKHKIELWHSLIDGSPDEESFMDWEVTEDYCRKFAEAFGVKIYFSWKEGGFKREMQRHNERTAPTTFETPDGLKTVGGTNGKKSTRRKFPQISAKLSQRWCSAYLKIDVCATAIRNQSRFDGLKTVVISGERGEESPAREKYSDLEIDRADNRYLGEKISTITRKLKDGTVKTWEVTNVIGEKDRYVDRWRPIKNWPEEKVWQIIEKYKVVSHPCYYMGWSRCSCKFCIFGNKQQMSSAYSVSPRIGDKLVACEIDFDHTMKRDAGLRAYMNGKAYESITPELKKMSTSKVYTGKIFTNQWILPSGAFGDSCGPS